jgi:phage shock protein C
MKHRLYRNINKSSVGGVCAGLSEYYDIDVTIFRLVFVIGTIFTVFPFILTYLIMWIVIPEK